jgi:hypothetical protein
MLTNIMLGHGYMCEVLMSLKYDRVSFVKVIRGVTHCQCGRISGGLMCLNAVAFTAKGAFLRSQDLADISRWS